MSSIYPWAPRPATAASRGLHLDISPHDNTTNCKFLHKISLHCNSSFCLLFMPSVLQAVFISLSTQPPLSSTVGCPGISPSPGCRGMQMLVLDGCPPGASLFLFCNKHKFMFCHENAHIFQVLANLVCVACPFSGFLGEERQSTELLLALMG